MATFKAIIEPHYKRADGTYNIRIRVTHNRKKKLMSTQLYVTADDLTRSLNIKTESIINATDELIKRYRDICNQAGERLSDMTVMQVVELIKDECSSNKSFYLDFIQYGRQYAKHLKDTGHDGNAKLYSVAMNSLVKFTNQESLGINDINVKFLKAYVEWLNNQPAPKNRVKGSRAASLYLSNIRALHNKAKFEYNDEDMGIIKVPLSPFVRFKVPKIPITRKRALTIDQMQSLIEVSYRGREGIRDCNLNRFNLAKDVFLLSFGLVGMNSVDMFNCTSFGDDRITYNRTKTKNRRDDKAEISISVEPQLKALFEKYRDKTGARVFNFYKLYSNSSVFNATVNKMLKEIGKCIGVDDLEFYAARHSWATIARNDASVDMHTVHIALNHVDEKMKVTDIYVKKDYSLIDRANKSVLALFDFTNFNTEEPRKEDKIEE